MPTEQSWGLIYAMFFASKRNERVRQDKCVSKKAEQKHKLINLVTSNFIYKGGKLDLELTKPFDMIMISAESGKWLPEQDSNLRQSD